MLVGCTICLFADQRSYIIAILSIKVFLDTVMHRERYLSSRAIALAVDPGRCIFPAAGGTKHPKSAAKKRLHPSISQDHLALKFDLLYVQLHTQRHRRGGGTSDETLVGLRLPLVIFYSEPTDSSHRIRFRTYTCCSVFNARYLHQTQLICAMRYPEESTICPKFHTNRLQPLRSQVWGVHDPLAPSPLLLYL